MVLHSVVVVLFAIMQPSLSYIQLGRPDDTNFFIPRIPTPRPHQLPRDEDVRYEILPSMITAISPSASMLSNGTYETMYSMQYHPLFERKRVGKGIFKRGVFANDPPISTCTPCGGGATTYYPPNTTTASQTATCTIITYFGVFRSKVGTSIGGSTPYCYDSGYSGVFQPSTTSSTGLPCCFTIPASCKSNASTSMTYTFTTGVFSGSSISPTMQYLSNTTEVSSRTASPSSSSSISLVSSTRYDSGSSSGISSSTASSKSSSKSTSSAGSGTSSKPSSSSPISFSQSLSSSSSSSSSTLVSVFAISSSTVTVMLSTTNSPMAESSSKQNPSSNSMTHPQSPGPRPGAGDSSQVTLAVITAPPPPQSLSSTIVSTVPNTVYGCGEASGSGMIIGTGTVYIGPYGIVPIISSGTVSGYASKVVGCGTIFATSGSFTGSATIIGCGQGSGSATLIGSGTVYPAALGGLVPVVSSGTVIGSGSVVGCGTIIGSGTFSATVGSVTTIFPINPPTTVEVYVSYCPVAMGMGTLSLALNGTTPSLPPSRFNSTSSTTLNATALSNSTLDNPLCHVCGNDVGTCCPLGVACNSLGHCPGIALMRSGYLMFGYNIVAAANLTT